MILAYLRSPTCWALFSCSLLATALLTPLVMWFARRIGAVDVGGYRRVYTGSMPLLGGLAIVVPFVAVCLLGALSPTSMFGTIRHMRFDLVSLAAGAMAIVAVGLADDLVGLRARVKLALQIGVALLVCLSGHTVLHIHLPFGHTLHFGAFGGILFTVIWIVAIINALNLIDGLDGLATGVALLSAAGLAVVSAMQGVTFVTLLCVALSGSLLAFLVFNFHPARIFLGDTGSMLLGYLLACIPLMGSSRNESVNLFVAPMLVLGLPIFEILVSVLRRYARGRPLFTADKHHTHHRLLRRGLSQRQAVLTLYVASLLFACAAVAQQIFPSVLQPAGWIPMGFVVAAVVWILWMADYFEQMLSRDLLQRRGVNNLYSAFARYAYMSLHSRTGCVKADDILPIGRIQLGLRRLEVWFEEGPELIGASGLENDWAAGEVRKIAVKSWSGDSIAILYQHSDSPTEAQSHDVEACLAAIFDQCRIAAPHRPGRRPEVDLRAKAHTGMRKGVTGAPSPAVSLRAVLLDIMSTLRGLFTS